MENDKEQQQRETAEEIKKLPGSCRDDFINLTLGLARTSKNSEERDQAYKEWIGEVLSRAKTQYCCAYCGREIPPDENGMQEVFDTPECEKEWKRHLWMVLDAFMPGLKIKPKDS